MMRFFTLVLAFSLISTGLLIGQVDTDNDGMPDDFENTYSLDSNDPTDAFADADGDGVLNLQESILNTDPTDSNSPVFYEHKADDPLENIYSRMRMGDMEPALIRMTGGEYDFDYGFFAGGDYKLMIQGGWNDDFTSYDPCLYPTILKQSPNGLGGTISTAAILGTSYSVILDGLEFVEGNAGIGPIELINDASVSRIHLHNLKSHGNPAYGALISGRLGCTAIDLTVSACSFTMNGEGGLTFASDGNPEITSRIINCTFDNPDAIEGGVEFRSIGGETAKNIKVVNSILWNNGVRGPFAETGAVGGLSLTTEHCAFDTATLQSEPEETNTISVAPEYVDSASGNYSLIDSSPLIDAGIETGLRFNGNGMDIGAVEAGECILSSIEEIINELAYKIYPNPVINELVVELDPTQTHYLEVTDVNGQLLTNQFSENQAIAKLDLGSYVSGIYFLRVREKGSQVTMRPTKFIKL